MIAIHQPHYFPWIGYLDKMAKADKFVLMDTVQLEKRSYMLRNRIIDLDSNIRYLTIITETQSHYNYEYRGIKTKNFKEWTDKQKGTLIWAYKKSPYFDEIWEAISPIFIEEREYLCDITIQSIEILRKLFEIRTPLLLQSALKIDKSYKKDKLILEICKAAGADVYYSGNGAKKYMDNEMFEREGVHVIYQQFEHPVYKQMGNHKFEPGLSALDMLFNCGIKRARELFWNQVNAMLT